MLAVIHNAKGSTLIEIFVALSIIAALASIAIPTYADHTEKAQATKCIAHRKIIEEAEHACGIQQGEPCLSMGKLVGGNHLREVPECPLQGVYTWISTNPNSSNYLKLGCSIHYWPDHPEG